MSSDFLLSRLSLTGKLDKDTPLEVILIIADVHCIDYSNLKSIDDIDTLLTEINSNNVESVSKSRKDEDYEKISHFINPDKNVIWNKDDLEIAFLYLISFSDPRFYKDVHPAFAFGAQTPENPRTLNECVVYTLCKYYSIELSLQTKIDEMVSMLRYFLSSKELVIQAITNKLYIADLNAKRLLDIEYIIHKSIYKSPAAGVNKKSQKDEPVDMPEISENHEKYKFPPDYQKLVEISQNVNTYYPTEDAIKTYKVTTYEDAIVIASLLYGLDISNEENPLNVYKSLCTNPKFSIGESNFNSNFCIEMYTTSGLRNLLKNEGYLDNELDVLDKEAMYEANQILSLSNTFYHGKKKPYLFKETLIENNLIDNLKTDTCISFGTVESGYIVYTYNELYNLYNNDKILYEPIDLRNKVPLSSNSIKKLRYIIKNVNDRTEEVKKFKELIDNLGNSYNSSDSLASIIKNSIDEDTIGTKKDVLFNFMDILIKLSMNMRGWSGKGEYPIKNSHELSMEIIDSRVTESITKMNIYIEAYPELCKSILDLPLVRYYKGEYIMGDEMNGKTLGERIKIMKGVRSNPYSCIKLSSNWIASSLYKYCKYFNIDPKFNIEDLKQIS